MYFKLLLIKLCWSTRFCTDVTRYFLRLYKTNHRFNSVTAENLDKLQFEINIALNRVVTSTKKV